MVNILLLMVYIHGYYMVIIWMIYGYYMVIIWLMMVNNVFWLVVDLPL